MYNCPAAFTPPPPIPLLSTRPGSAQEANLSTNAVNRGLRTLNPPQTHMHNTMEKKRATHWNTRSLRHQHEPQRLKHSHNSHHSIFVYVVLASDTQAVIQFFSFSHKTALTPPVQPELISTITIILDRKCKV